MALQAGKLRHRVTIETPTEAQDAYGEPVKTWRAIPDGECWARKEDLSGRELFQAQQISAEITTQFTIRHRTDIDARMSIRDGQQFYHIKSVQDPDGLSERLLLLCARSFNETGVDAP